VDTSRVAQAEAVPALAASEAYTLAVDTGPGALAGLSRGVRGYPPRAMQQRVRMSRLPPS